MRIDDAYGARVGAVHDVYLEADGSPRWIFTLRRRVLIPGWDAIAGAPRLWSLDELTPAFETETRRWYAAGKDHTGWAAHVRSDRSSR
jgi:hypothetical protein